MPQPQSSLTVRPRFDPDRRVVAITGAHGFLGRQLLACMEADRRYARVLAIDIRRPELPLNKTTFHKVDLTQPSADAELAQLLKVQRVDSLAHLAFLSRPTHNAAWAHELEAIGTLHVLSACAACQLRKVILRSCTALYGPHAHNPNFLSERHERRGLADPFFRDKLEAERLTLRFAAENPAVVVTLLRLAPILGRHVDNYVSRYLRPQVVPVLLGYDPLVQLLHEQDAVAALKLCLDADFSGEYNIAGEGVLPLSTVIALAGRLALPLPALLARSLANLAWMAQVGSSPSAFVDFLRYLCVADTTRSRRDMNFSAEHDVRQVIADFAGFTNAADRRPARLGQ